MSQTYTLQVGKAHLTFETGKMAKQASAAIHARHGETVVLLTTCISPNPREGLDFFPLLVDYEERFYSAGKIPGGFIKREGRPSETAILSARVIDRSIRSLFPQHMRNDVHVVSTVHSVDQENPPQVLAINAASLALTLSEIPWAGPVGAVRVGHIDGTLVINPTESEMLESSLDLVVAGHMDGITMVEAGAQEVSEDVLVDALELAHQSIKEIVAFQEKIRQEIGKEKLEISELPFIEEIDTYLQTELYGEIENAVRIHEKQPRAEAISQTQEKALQRFEESYPESKGYIAGAVEKLVKKAMRSLVLNEHFRSDGRRLDEVRPITCEVEVLPRTHGSALFTRGETQSLGVATLGMLGEDDQILDGLKHDEPAKRFMLHYNFPPYSVGEVRPMRGPGRREIGHGALAERAVKPLMPEEEAFPYAIRVVSDILESNGSSSMASVCSASLSLMDAGVPIAKACAGIAMGLIKEGDQVAVLTDIQGLEDHYGDMDFKVAGTADGVTALQMDNKAGGITREILQQALDQAKKGRMHILEIMNQTIQTPRADLSEYAPRITTLMVAPEKIRDIIGPGGKTVRGIVSASGAKIDIEDDGRVFVAAVDEKVAAKAIAMINEIIRDVEEGEIFVGKVVRMMSFGAFVELLPGKDGLLHVSEVSTHHIPSIEEVLSIGDPVLVIVKEIDDLGRVNLSRRRILADVSQLDAAEYGDILKLEEDRDKKIEELVSKGGGAPKRENRGSSGRGSDRRSGGGDRKGGGGSSRGSGNRDRR
ncbi:MAG TPA: polyribonucleotide nucleotidyltransferase [Synergistaceae bacterium]|nr:polyribonucleotide nucleotidyltransferase [Synergistaceae bacterium]HPJ25937.1 polyribonucleotide nucleotidyltransferase [Synergistaceae bacterium]HPQ37433.1 polyribonucleotide nucleotidyltransferase [Synergistaceae bacterium]